MRNDWRHTRSAFGLVTAVAFLGSGVPGPPSDTVRATVAMGIERAAHTATTLPDGRVLVAGGFVEQGSPVGAEVFDPARDVFDAASPMRETRHSHTATPLRDGRVLIVGGYGAGRATLASAEVFDPRTRTFTRTGDLGTPRADHVAVPLADGSVLVAGGLGTGWTFLDTAEIYDPATGRFSPTGRMTTPRESHVAVALAGGRVLIIGGHHGRREAMVVLDSIEAYDPRTRAFTRVGTLQVPRHKHDAIALADGRILITGGADRRDFDGVYRSTEFFDPVRGASSPGPSLQVARYKHAGTSVRLGDGRVLVAGGGPQPEIFDPVANTFTLTGGDPGMAGLFSASAPLGDGRVLITGGYGQGTRPRATAWIYGR